MSGSKKDGIAGANCNDDDYVAQLLAKDARDCSLRYSALGIYGTSKRSINSAPKPNTRFLKNIIRETDSHNANLKRKEEEEAREKMRSLRERRDKSSRSSISGERNEREHKRRRVESPGRREEKREKSRGRDRDRSRHTRKGEEEYLYLDSDCDARPRRQRRHNREDQSDAEEVSRESRVGRHDRKDERDRRSRHHRRHESSKHKSERAEKAENEETVSRRSKSHRRSRHYHDERSRSRSRSPNRTHRRRRHSRERERISGQHMHTKNNSHSLRADTHASVDENASSSHPPGIQVEESGSKPLSPNDGDSTHSDDSDPLSNLIGPAPPPKTSADTSQLVRSRGRGAYKTSNSSNIDSHFSSNYDPALDVQIEIDHDAKDDRPGHIRPVPGLLSPDGTDKHVGDDWDMALEALRDRALWKRKGAERLRQAGFEGKVVEKWEASRSFAGLDSNDSKDIETVKWAKEGEGREWDRGKVIDEDGHVSVKPFW